MWCDGIVTDDFIANLLEGRPMPVIEFEKSVDILFGGYLYAPHIILKY